MATVPKAGIDSGTCFTLSYDKLEKLLKSNGRLRENEMMESVEIGANGITVFIGEKK